MSDDRFIQSCKIAVGELMKVITADIDTAVMEKETTVKNAIKLKKKAITSCKNMLGSILNHDRKQEKWVRATLDKIVDASQGVVESLYSGLEDVVMDSDVIGNDADSISTMIDTKLVAFNDVMEIEDIVHDVKSKLEEEDIMLEETDYKGGYAEKYADKFARMKDNSGYRPDIDAVVIDPEGTVGEIVEINDIRIALPKKPIKAEIDWGKRFKQDQFWRRQAPPKDLTVRTAKRHEDYIDSEYMKKRNGYWFMNNGVATYITGAHWFMMTHCYTGADGGYYYYSAAQRKLFLFLEAMYRDNRCLGIILEKIRRFGATDCIMAFILCKTIEQRNKLSGMTSKTDTDAKSNFVRLTTMFSHLPFYFKPMCMDEKSKSELEFAQPGNKLKKAGQEKEVVDVALNTRINFRPTNESSYDGEALLFYFGDEFSKWKKQNGNTLTHFTMVRKCLTKGRRITGKAILISTVEFMTGKDTNDPDALAGDRYKYLYYNSDPRKRDGNGQTVTNLYKIFISCFEHYEGFIDKYGNMIVEDPKSPVRTMDGENMSIGVKTYLQNVDEALKDNPKQLLEEHRKNPRTEEDGFKLAINMCMFNQANILAQIKYNDNLDGTHLRRGNFEWYQGVADSGHVIFIDKPDGRFLVSWLPEEGLRNNVKFENGLWIPLNRHIGNFGIDPYRVNKTVDGKGSKGSIHGFSGINSSGAPNFNFFLEYINRPDSKEIFFDDAIKAMVFYGMPALIENNVNNLIDEMYRRGYRKFSMTRTDKEKDKLSEDERVRGGMPSTSENVSQMINAAIESFVENNVGSSEMYFNATLEDWLAFDDKNRTKRDASISSAYALIGNTRKKRRQREAEEPVATRPMFRIYENVGTYGKLKNG